MGPQVEILVPTKGEIEKLISRKDVIEAVEVLLKSLQDLDLASN